MRAYDPFAVVLPSERRRRESEAELMFGRVTVRIVHAGWLVAAAILWLGDQSQHSALLTPIDPDLHAALIGAGVFVGCIVAVVERDGWALGLDGGHRGPPQGIAAALLMLGLVAGSGFGGHLVAKRWWNWRAFHGLATAPSWAPFTIASRYEGRHSMSVGLRAADGTRVEVACTYAFYDAVSVGERVLLPVETGRDGARRVSLPPADRLRPA